SLASATHWALLGFQRDKWSDKSRLRFTVNVTVVRRDAWDNARKAHPWMHSLAVTGEARASALSSQFSCGGEGKYSMSFCTSAAIAGHQRRATRCSERSIPAETPAA